VKDIKTEKGKKINRKTLIVTLNIAQEKQMVYIRCSDGSAGESGTRIGECGISRVFACLCVARRQVCFIGLRFRLASILTL